MATNPNPIFDDASVALQQAASEIEGATFGSGAHDASVVISGAAGTALASAGILVEAVHTAAPGVPVIIDNASNANDAVVAVPRPAE